MRAKGHGGAEHIDGFQQGKEQVGHVEASANARMIESRLVPSRALMKARCARDPRAITSSSVAATTPCIRKTSVVSILCCTCMCYDVGCRDHTVTAPTGLCMVRYSL